MRAPRHPVAALLVLGAFAGACGGDDEPAASAGTVSTAPVSIDRTPTTSMSTTAAPSMTTTTTTTTTPVATTTTTISTPTTSTPTTSTTSTSTTSTSTTTAAPPATIAPTGSGAEIVPFRPLDLGAESVEVGRSVLGAPIIAERLGTPGGRRVLVVGVIHGNEPAGVDIVRLLRELGAPDGIELWLVETMNPDGLAADDRHNANDVDLNRNFPYRWGPIGEPGDGQYAGPAPATEPETQAMVNFIAQLRPDIAIWYHQDLFVINPSDGRDGRIRARYAELTGLPMGEITGGIYTGIAATWARTELAAQDAVAFIVELGPTLSADEAVRHAEAVRTIAVEG